MSSDVLPCREYAEGSCSVFGFRVCHRGGEGPMNLTDEGLRLLAASPIAHQTEGHDHFWERAISRRQFLAATGLAGGAIVTSSVWTPLLAGASSSAGPTPIPYGPTLGGQLFHFQFVGPNLDESSIFNFKGLVGVAEIDGPGAG